jgi:hypothetical protein
MSVRRSSNVDSSVTEGSADKELVKPAWHTGDGSIELSVINYEKEWNG